MRQTQRGERRGSEWERRKSRGAVENRRQRSDDGWSPLHKGRFTWEQFSPGTAGAMSQQSVPRPTLIGRSCFYRGGSFTERCFLGGGGGGGGV